MNRLTAVATSVLICATTYTSPAQRDSTLPTFRSQSELVLVPIVVTRKGEHVSGLAADKFTVLENGVPQQLASVDEIKASSALSTQRMALQPNTYTNFLPETRADFHLTIYAFDLLNTPAIVQQHARQSLIRFLSALPESDEPMMLVALTGNGLRVLHTVTTSPAELRAAVQTIKAKDNTGQNLNDSARSDEQARGTAMQIVSAHNQGKPEKDPDEIARLADLLRELPDSYRQNEIMNRTAMTLGMLQDLARALAGIPGRKSLVWVTGGISYTEGTAPALPYYNVRGGPRSRSSSGVLFGQIADSNDFFDRTWELLSDGNVAVYPVDMEQVFNPCFSDPSLMGQRCGEHELTKMGFGVRAQAMNGFSDKTGGKYCELQQSLEQCFRSVSKHGSQYYIAAYYPGSRGKPGYRKLSVKVSLPDAHVYTRSGYFFGRTIDTAQGEDGELHRVLASPLDASGIHLSVRWLGPNSTETKAAFELVVSPGSISLGNGDRVQLTLTGAAYNNKGEFVARLAKKIESRLRPDDIEKINKTGLLYRDTVQLSTGETQVRFVVRDAVSGRVGSVTAYRTEN